MLRSMTGYGRGTAAGSFGEITVEIQAVNRRYFDVAFNFPPELRGMDMDIRRWLAEHVSRGAITVAATLVYHDYTPFKPVPNLAYAKSLKEGWERILEATGSDAAFDPSWIVSEEGLFSQSEGLLLDEGGQGPLREAFDKALEAFQQHRTKEGEEIAGDISGRLGEIGRWIEQIAAASGGASECFREKLVKVWKRVFSDEEEIDDRLLREVAIYTDKIDYTEEITRARCHLDVFHSKIREGEGSMGKNLDFLLQELFREVNTVASKASDAQVSQWVVEAKSEIEKIREQLQNVE